MSAPTVDEIRARMARIRARAHRKASRLGEETRQFLDWKHYVKLFPWGALAAAAAVGYFVVPRRVHVTPHDPTALADLARRNQIVIAPAATPRRPGLLDGALGLVGNMILRAGIAYASHQVGKLMTGTASVDAPQGNHRHEHVQPLA